MILAYLSGVFIFALFTFILSAALIRLSRRKGEGGCTHCAEGGEDCSSVGCADTGEPKGGAG